MLNSACVAAFLITSGSGVKSPRAASKTACETPAALAAGQSDCTHCAGDSLAASALAAVATRMISDRIRTSRLRMKGLLVCAADSLGILARAWRQRPPLRRNHPNVTTAVGIATVAGGGRLAL